MRKIRSICVNHANDQIDSISDAISKNIALIQKYKKIYSFYIQSCSQLLKRF